VGFQTEQIMAAFLDFLAKVKNCKMILSSPLRIVTLMMGLILQCGKS
jgi:hypothetical protein